MKSKFAFLMLMLMLPQILFAAHPESLKNLIEDYTYSMTVEWDQSDMTFANQKRADFVHGLSTLVANGLTKEEIISASGVNLESIKDQVEMLNLKSSEEVASFLISRKEFKKGANWVGDVVLATIFFTPFILMIGMMINSSLHRGERLDRINACIAANPTNQDACFDFI
jgi:hypothetical protein